MVRLGGNRYGKAEVRVVHIDRGAAGGHAVRDWNVSTSLSGDLADSHLTGDNSKLLTTDTQKNTAYAFARRLGGVEPEVLALALARHYLDTQEPITRARVAIEQVPWDRIGPGQHSFVRSGRHRRTTVVVHDADEGTSVVSGVQDLVVLNTTASEFWGFPTDEYTTLAPTTDRMLATQVSARWRYRSEAVGGVDWLEGMNWGKAHAHALDTLLTTFAATYSYSLQQMLYAIGTALITDDPAICEVRLQMPNKHHFLVDLEPFGLDNPDAVYYAADRPYGLIEGTVLADDADDRPLAWL